MYCDVCKEYPRIADTESSLYKGCKNIRDAPLKTHDMSVKHKACISHKLSSLFPRSQTMDKAQAKVSNANKEMMLALFNSAFFIVKTNMAFRRFPELMQLQQKMVYQFQIISTTRVALCLLGG